MTLAGWILMLIAVGGMSTFLGYCIYLVVETPGSTEHMHSQPDIEPPDKA